MPTEAHPGRRPARARRVLAGRLSVSLLGNADPAALAAQCGRVVEKRLAFLRNAAILRAPDPFAALTAANAIGANERVLHAAPLFYRPRLSRQAPNSRLRPGLRTA